MAAFSFLTAIWRNLVGDPWRLTDERFLPGSDAYRRTVAPTALIAILCLTAIEYFGYFNTFESLKWLRFGYEYWHLAYWTYWSLFRLIFYALAPLILARLFLPIPIREMGLGPRTGAWHWRTYLGLYLALLPLLIAVSFLPGFIKTYPFYDNAGQGWDHFLIWEFLYGLQFLSLEFFFRGFLVHALKYAVGSLAVPLMMIPYVMIHFGKPLPEALGAIFAGLLLGSLSLKTGRIWGGLLLHVSVAMTMDVLSLVHRGVLFR